MCVLASSCWIVVGVLRSPRICTCIKVCLGRTIALINFTCSVCFSINRGFGVQAVNAFNSLTQSYRNTTGLNLLCAILLLSGLYTRTVVRMIRRAKSIKLMHVCMEKISKCFLFICFRLRLLRRFCFVFIEVYSLFCFDNKATMEVIH